MLSVVHRQRYAKHRGVRDSQSARAARVHELILPGMLFGSLGAIAWAVRGSNGWGGIDGTIVPGMMWAILWFYICWRKGLACYGVPLFLGLGIALGGELGYGQYVSWIRGLFNVGDEVIHVSRRQGWLWFFLCGIGWGAPGGVLLGWALSQKTSWSVWLGRLTIPCITAWLGWSLVHWYPALFFPNHDLGIYATELGRHLDRTVYTNTQNFTLVAWWIGAVLVAAIQRDKASVVMCAIIGAGFGPGFSVAAIWCLGYEYAPAYIDWWKMWELQSGFNLGLLYVLALYWCVRQADKAHTGDGAPLDAPLPEPSPPVEPRVWCVQYLAVTLAAFLLVLIPYLERSPKTGFAMGLLFVVFMFWLMFQVTRGLDTRLATELYGRLSLIFCVFVFLLVTFRGASSTLGLVLELYPPESVEQYSWPPRRTMLFLLMVSGVVIWTLYQMVRTLWPAGNQPRDSRAAGLAERITDMMSVLTVVGAVSIWPSKIGILYVGFLGVALWAFNRMNRKMDSIDLSQTKEGTDPFV